MPHDRDLKQCPKCQHYLPPHLLVPFVVSGHEHRRWCPLCAVGEINELHGLGATELPRGQQAFALLIQVADLLNKNGRLRQHPRAELGLRALEAGPEGAASDGISLRIITKSDAGARELTKIWSTLEAMAGVLDCFCESCNLPSTAEVIKEFEDSPELLQAEIDKLLSEPPEATLARIATRVMVQGRLLEYISKAADGPSLDDIEASLEEARKEGAAQEEAALRGADASSAEEAMFDEAEDAE